MKEAVVLLSGGIDSVTTMAIARAEGYVVYALSFNYGQRHAVELEKARAAAAVLEAKKHLVLDIDLKAIGGSALTDTRAVPKDRSAAAHVAINTDHLCPGAKHHLPVMRPCLG